MTDGAPPGRLSRDDLRPLLERMHGRLAAHREEVDDLNVFPVPDGDTGTNMTLTVRAAVEALDDLPADGDPPERARAIARGAMRGARGNSGVILSQVLRALVEEVDARGSLDPEGLRVALRRARELAYDAVSDPVEGTILTAITAAADAAAAGGDDLVAVVGAVVGAVDTAVARTEELLDANREAGVVDAGARGFALVVEALHGHLTGAEPDRRPARHHVERRGTLAARESGSPTYRYEVQYLLDAGDEAVAPLRAVLDRLGDSVVVVSGGDLVSVHVHTNDIGPAIEAALDHGRPSRIAVVAFEDQLAERAAAREHVPLRCVAVVPAGPLHDLVREHAAIPVPGTAGDLPSVAALLEAIGSAAAGRVVVLPGHRNAVPTARQAAREADADVVVLEQADTVPAVLAALAVCEPTAADDAMVDAMRDAAATVVAGEVVPAVRTARTPVGDVEEGQLLAVFDDEVVSAHEEPLAALRSVLDRCAEVGCEAVTLILGAGVPEDEADKAVALVEEVLGDVEAEVIGGAQRPARYLLGIE